MQKVKINVGKNADSKWSNVANNINLNGSNIGLDSEPDVDVTGIEDKVIIDFFKSHVLGRLVVISEEYAQALELKRAPINERIIKLKDILSTVVEGMFNCCESSDAVFSAKEFVKYTIDNKMKRKKIIKRIAHHPFVVLFGVNLNDVVSAIKDDENKLSVLQSIIDKTFLLVRELKTVEYKPEDIDYIIPLINKCIDSSVIPELKDLGLFNVFIKDFFRILHINRHILFKMYCNVEFTKILSFVTHVLIYTYKEYCSKDKLIKYKLKSQFSQVIDFIRSRVKILQELGTADDEHGVLKLAVHQAIKLLETLKDESSLLPEFTLADGVDIYSKRCPVFNKPMSYIVKGETDEENKFEYLFRRKDRAIRFSANIDDADLMFDSADEYY